MWLTVIGLGEDGLAGLGDEAKRAIAAAATVFGGERHLELAAPLIAGRAVRWPVPFDAAVQAVVDCRGAPTVVLASGDPFFFGVGVTLSRRIAITEMRVLPAPPASVWRRHGSAGRFRMSRPSPCMAGRSISFVRICNRARACWR